MALRRPRPCDRESSRASMSRVQLVDWAGRRRPRPTPSSSRLPGECSMKIEMHEFDPVEPQILALDVENGPSWGWGPSGYTYSQVFCIAWKWVGDAEDTVQSVLLDWRQD